MTLVTPGISSSETSLSIGQSAAAGDVFVLRLMAIRSSVSLDDEEMGTDGEEHLFDSRLMPPGGDRVSGSPEGGV